MTDHQRAIGPAGLEAAIARDVVAVAVRNQDRRRRELLSLQAGMYKYSQELDLTSKIVEKATSGLKDTLKTQV